MKTKEATTAATTNSNKKPKVSKAKAPKVAKAAKAAKSPKQPAAKGEARVGSKKEIVLKLLRREQGATIAKIAKATNWQNHSIRGFLSAQVGKKMKLKIESAKNEAGDRTYRIVTQQSPTFRFKPPREVSQGGFLSLASSRRCCTAQKATPPLFRDAGIRELAIPKR